jgi:hypothetical protein
MTDALADVALLRAAGYYLAGYDPDEDMPHPHAARPGHMPSVDDLVAELETARGLLKALLPFVPVEVDPDDFGNDKVYCAACAAPALYRNDYDGDPVEAFDDPARHAPDCPWRKAKEYVDGLEAKSE